jgi:putative LysE/RhtB family amino acid efflux pump
VSGSFAVGVGLGLFVAAQLGPLSLLLIRSTLRSGVTVGLAIGAGIAVIDTLYACAGAAGAAPLLSVDPLRLALGVIGAGVLVALGVRTLWSAFRVRMGGEVADEVASPRRAFLTALAATASNPLTIASWAAVFAAASTAGATDGAARTLALLGGVGLGSLGWCSGLACTVAAGQRVAGPRVVRGIDLAAGTGLVGFGGLLAYRTFDEH